MAEHFYKVFDRILADKELTYPEMILYGVIVRLAMNEQKQCFASNQALAEIMRCSKSSIGKWLDKLSKRGYIKRSVHYVEGTKHIDKRYISVVYPADMQEGIPSAARGYAAILREGIPRIYKRVSRQITKIVR